MLIKKKKTTQTFKQFKLLAKQAYDGALLSIDFKLTLASKPSLQFLSFATAQQHLKHVKT